MLSPEGVVHQTFPFASEEKGHITLRLQYQVKHHQESHPRACTSRGARDHIKDACPLTSGLQALPELVIEAAEDTVIHRVNERTLSPVNASERHEPDHCHPHAGSLYLCIHKAQDLSSVDGSGNCDPSAVLFYGERVMMRTPVGARGLKRR
jgi:hypothetical protein